MRNVDRGWFITEGRDGDRTLEQQMVGLEALASEVPGKRVLDFGCAEGLIGMALMQAGAASVTGVDSIEEHLVVGRRIAREQGIDITLVHGNLNHFDVSALPSADIVLLLAILHKLRDPSAFARAAAKLATDLVVIRLPPRGLVIRDMRSLMVPHDIGAVMAEAGLLLEFTVPTINDEWLGYFRRPKKPGVEVDPLQHRGEAVVPKKFEPPAAPVPVPEPTPAPAPEPEKVTAVVNDGKVPAPAQHVTTAEVQADTPHADEKPKSDGPKDETASTDASRATLTEDDAAADLADQTRPDHPGVSNVTQSDIAADLADQPREGIGETSQPRARRARAAKSE